MPICKCVANFILSDRDAQIAALFEQQYGARLERMLPRDKLRLRSVLSIYLCLREEILEFTIAHAVCESMPDLDDNIYNDILQLEGISTICAEKLIELITDQQLTNVSK